MKAYTAFMAGIILALSWASHSDQEMQQNIQQSKQQRLELNKTIQLVCDQTGENCMYQDDMERFFAGQTEQSPAARKYYQ